MNEIKDLQEFLEKEYTQEIKYMSKDSTVQKAIRLLNKKKFELQLYLDKDGKFNYNEYKEIQTRGNHEKLTMVTVDESSVKFISEYLKTHLKEKATFGLCHGTRNGKEIEWFSKYMNCKVIGTEISDTATQFPNTIEWDFHNVKDDWINNIDFIYSNSFDHSYDPEKCINAWISCLKPDGICVIEHPSANAEATTSKLDPFGCCITVFPYLILKWSKGKFSVREILHAPVRLGWLNYFDYLIIKKNK